MEFLIGVLASLAATAICFLLPGNRWLAIQCIEAALRKLPEAHRKEMREEWYAELDAYAGGFWSLCWALDLLRGADVVACELRQTEALCSDDDQQAKREIPPIPLEMEGIGLTGQPSEYAKFTHKMNDYFVPDRVVTQEEHIEKIAEKAIKSLEEGNRVILEIINRRTKE